MKIYPNSAMPTILAMFLLVIACGTPHEDLTQSPTTPTTQENPPSSTTTPTQTQQNPPSSTTIPTEVLPNIALTKPFGIKNVGNSCYANSAMQVLMLMDNEYFKDAKEKYIDDPNVVKSNVITQNEQDFLKTVFAFRNAYIDAKADNEETHKALGKKVESIIETGIKKKIYDEKIFETCGQQQDATEFLLGMTSRLGDTKYPCFRQINHVIKLIPGGGTRESKQDEGKIEGAILLKLTTSTHDGTSLQTLVDEYFKTEKRTGVYLNGDSGPKVDADVFLRLAGKSDYLFASLKRYTYDEAGNPIKLETKIDFDNGEIDLTNFIEPKSDKQLFKLVGIAKQSGSLKSGHYTADVLYGAQWYEANDSDISEKTWDQVKQESKLAYLLLLKRVIK